MRLKVSRINDNSIQTIGAMLVIDNQNNVKFGCYTLELPDLGNQPNISCIPKGTYRLTKRTSEKHGNHFMINDVNNRSYILIHSGNYSSQIQGCMLVGDDLSFINNDSYIDVSNSKDTVNKLLELLPNNTTIEII